LTREPPASLPFRWLQAETSDRPAQGSQSGATQLFFCTLRLPDCVALPTQGNRPFRSTAAVANIRCDHGPKKEETGTKAFPSLFARFRFRNYADSLYEIGIVNTPLTEGLNFHWLATQRVTE
jgi:hypothetical protein